MNPPLHRADVEVYRLTVLRMELLLTAHSAPMEYTYGWLGTLFYCRAYRHRDGEERWWRCAGRWEVRQGEYIRPPPSKGWKPVDRPNAQVVYYSNLNDSFPLLEEPLSG